MANFITVSPSFNRKSGLVDLSKVSGLQQVAYTVTWEPMYAPNFPPELRDEIALLNDEVQLRPTQRLVERLRQLVRQYPHVPSLQNYLMLAYAKMGNDRKASEVLEETLKQHPRYLLGLVNKATEMLMVNKDTAGVERLFGGPPTDIGLLYPDRTEFHVSEIANFTGLSFLYFLAKGNPAVAENRLRTLRDIDYYSLDYLRSMKNRLDTTWLQFNIAKMYVARTNTSTVEGYFRAKEQQTTEPPAVENPEIEWLYQHGMGKKDNPLPADKRDTLLALPRPSLTRDLSKVLLDTIFRHDYFANQEWDATRQSFPNHALLLAAELRAKECLEAVLEMLRQDGEFREFWWGDFLTDYYEPYFRQLFPAQADALRAFMQEPDVNTYSKTLISEAVEQATLADPTLKPVAQSWYADVLTFLLANAEDEHLMDSDLLSFIISDIVDLQLTDLLPLIRDAFGRRLVNESIGGDLTYTEEEMQNPAYAPDRRPLLPIAEGYAYWLDPAAYRKAHPEPQREKFRDDIFAELEAKQSEWDFLYENDKPLQGKGIKSSPLYIEDQQPRQVAPMPGRNDKVSVKYTNGTVLRDVKFKKVEADVKAGKCVLV